MYVGSVLSAADRRPLSATRLMSSAKYARHATSYSTQAEEKKPVQLAPYMRDVITSTMSPVMRRAAAFSIVIHLCCVQAHLLGNHPSTNRPRVEKFLTRAVLNLDFGDIPPTGYTQTVFLMPSSSASAVLHF